MTRYTVPWLLGSAAAALLVLASGCLEERTRPHQYNDGCTHCHGMGSDPTHQAHIVGDRGLMPPMACTDCHLEIYDAWFEVDEHGEQRHMNGTVEVRFDSSSVAWAQGVEASWSPRGCTVYCHGVTYDGAANPQPDWLGSLASGEALCGECHGNPPLRYHRPGDTDCHRCHTGAYTTDDGGNPVLDPTRHLNGKRTW